MEVLPTVLRCSVRDMEEEVVACWEALGSKLGSGESFRIFLGREGIFEGGDEIGRGTLTSSVGPEATMAVQAVVTMETAAVEKLLGSPDWV